MKSRLSSDLASDSIAMVVYGYAEDTILSGNCVQAKFNMHASACIGHSPLASC